MTSYLAKQYQILSLSLPLSFPPSLYVTIECMLILTHVLFTSLSSLRSIVFIGFRILAMPFAHINGLATFVSA